MNWTSNGVRALLDKVESIAVPVKFADGTVANAVVTGTLGEFPEMQVQVNGSWLKFDGTYSAIAASLSSGKPFSIEKNRV